MRVKVTFAQFCFGCDSRVLPALVVDSVLEAALLVVAFQGLHVQDLGFIQQLMMEAKYFLIFAVGWFWCGRGCHV
jgi:hypothetical protein